MNLNLIQRVVRLEKIIKNMRSFVGTVTDNEDPEGLQRIKVECLAHFPPGQKTKWCTAKVVSGGNNKGVVNTPQIGDTVLVEFENGKLNQPTFRGGVRNLDALPPEEFNDPKVNGEKTESGILIVKDDNDGSYKITVPQGAEVHLDGGGTLHLTGVTVITHGPTKLNNGEFGVVTDSPAHLCPLTGKPHAGSTTVKSTI